MDTKLKLPLCDIIGLQPSQEYGTMPAILDATHFNVCVFLPSCPYPFEYAQQIIKAVNSHDDMLGALEAILDDVDTYLDRDLERMVRNTILKAKGKA